MRAFEFLAEDDGQSLPKNHQKSVPGMKAHPGLDNSSPYAPWRFSALYLAGAGDESGEYEHDPSAHGPVGQALTTVGYSEGDKKIIAQAEKKFGTKSKQVTPDGSSEMDDTNKTSPIKKFAGFMK
jgi:hypothetical protein